MENEIFRKKLLKENSLMFFGKLKRVITKTLIYKMI